MQFDYLTPKLLRDAVAYNLRLTREGLHSKSRRDTYSCNAVRRAAIQAGMPAYERECLYQECMRFLKVCEGNNDQAFLWPASFPCGKRQLARSLFLLFLADVLEDGGLSDLPQI